MKHSWNTKVTLISILAFFSTLLSSFALDGLKKDYVSPDKKEKLLLFLENLGFNQQRSNIKKFPQELKNYGFQLITPPSATQNRKEKTDITPLTSYSKEEAPFSLLTTEQSPPQKTKEENPFLLEKELYNFNYTLRLETEAKYNSITGNPNYSPWIDGVHFNERIKFQGHKYFSPTNNFSIKTDFSYRKDTNFNTREYKLNDFLTIWNSRFYSLEAGFLNTDHPLPLLASPLTGAKLKLNWGDFSSEIFGGNLRRAIKDFYRIDTLGGSLAYKTNLTTFSLNGINYKEKESSLQHTTSYLLPPSENSVFSLNFSHFFPKTNLYFAGNLFYSLLDNHITEIKKDSAYNFKINYSLPKTNWILDYHLVKKNFNSLGGIYNSPDSEQLNFYLRYKLNEQIESFFELNNTQFNYSQPDSENILSPKLTLSLSPFTEIFPLKINISTQRITRDNTSKTLYKRGNESSISLLYTPLKNKLLDQWEFLYSLRDENDFNDNNQDFTHHAFSFQGKKEILKGLNLTLGIDHSFENWTNYLLSNKKTSFFLKGDYNISSYLYLYSYLSIGAFDFKNDADDYDLWKFSLNVDYKMSVYNKLQLEIDFNEFDYSTRLEENRKELLTNLKWITMF